MIGEEVNIILYDSSIKTVVSYVLSSMNRFISQYFIINKYNMNVSIKS